MDNVIYCLGDTRESILMIVSKDFCTVNYRDVTLEIIQWLMWCLITKNFGSKFEN